MGIRVHRRTGHHSSVSAGMGTLLVVALLVGGLICGAVEGIAHLITSVPVWKWAAFVGIDVVVGLGAWLFFRWRRRADRD